MSASSAPPDGSGNNKRRRLNQGEQSHDAHRQELDERGNAQFYDPDQNPQERRAVKKGLRNLYTKLNESRTDYLQPGSRGLEATLEEADELYKNIKQTSDATIDSRLLVATADLSYKKINNLTLGDSSTGVDVDDFITKCISFMQRADGDGVTSGRSAAEPTRTPSQRRRRHPGADDDAEDGDTMNWDYLGRNACLLYNARPCLSGFLLGPLSVQKKVRRQTQRKAREARAEASQATRPVELRDEDLEKQESANLTVVCAEIAQLLDRTQKRGAERAEKEYEALEGEPSDEDALDIMRKHGITDNGCVPLFDFCVNPKSFGQTVENLFYVSFLIKEGKVGLDFDSNGLPTLGIAPPKSVAERQETQRNQAVFTLDFDVWEDIVHSCGIQKSIIPHRNEEQYDDGTVDYGHITAELEDSDAYS